MSVRRKFNAHEVYLRAQSKWDNTAIPESTASKVGSMIMPPPNVTGSLHLGHALMSTIQDTMTRYRLMRKDPLLWVPGTDHAGIATQAVVERKLLEQNIDRRDLSRADFVKKIWEWKDSSGSTICNQLKRIGITVNWEREFFTLSPECTKSVRASFVDLFNRGDIYRASRIVNWSCSLGTAVSDLEVETEEITELTYLKIPGYEKNVPFGHMTYFKYPLLDNENEFIEIGTTRLSTMLGDLAVCVHPDDERYIKWHGKELRHPFIPDRIMKIYPHESVNPELGSGAVKVTPAHDATDFARGKDLILGQVIVFDSEGKIKEGFGKYSGMKRFDANEVIMEDLKELGLFVKYDTKYATKSKPLALARCQRSGDIIEPVTTPQWWMNCEKYAKQAVDAVRNKELILIPSIHNDTWFNWLENIQPWCISRQLVWGHRIPAYKADYNGESKWVAGTSAAEAAKAARLSFQCNSDTLVELLDDDFQDLSGVDNEEHLIDSAESIELKTFTLISIGQEPTRSGIVLKQDEDVLDTWYSSGLLPFSVFGWPKVTPDLTKYFPTEILETGSDILFFWVARMVMMSFAHMNQLPFRTVYLHALVRDPEGKKMSKSKGNVIDPVEVCDGCPLDQLLDKVTGSTLTEKEKERSIVSLKKQFPEGLPECGADALRAGLFVAMRGVQKINLSVTRIVTLRYFCNKLVQASNYFMELNSEPNELPEEVQPSTLSQKFVLHKINECVQNCIVNFDNYKYAEAWQELETTTLDVLCGIFIEICKLDKNDIELSKQNAIIGRYGLYTLLTAAHPAVPFITEYLSEIIRFVEPKESFCLRNEEYPNYKSSWQNIESDNIFSQIINPVVKKARSLRNETQVTPGIIVKGYVKLSDNILESFNKWIESTSTNMNEINRLILALSGTEISLEPLDIKCLPDMYLPGVVSADILLAIDISNGQFSKDKLKGKYVKELEAAKKRHAAAITKINNERFMSGASEEARESTFEQEKTNKTLIDEYTLVLEIL